MCGRYTLSQSAQAIAQAFQVEDVPNVEPRYNIAPTQPVATVLKTANHPQRQLRYLQWGLVPSWAKDPKMGSRLINARSETLAEKPSFRAAFKRRRCLVVADGFYEWKRDRQGKQPFFFRMRDGNDAEARPPFAFAGLWEHWESGDGSLIESCTILTTDANELLRPVHDRMPVILAASDYDRWLDPELQQPQALEPLLKPYPAEAMSSYPVSTAVNRPTHDSPDCIQPIEP